MVLLSKSCYCKFTRNKNLNCFENSLSHLPFSPLLTNGLKISLSTTLIIRDDIDDGPLAGNVRGQEDPGVPVSLGVKVQEQEEKGTAVDTGSPFCQQCQR